MLTNEDITKLEKVFTTKNEFKTLQHDIKELMEFLGEVHTDLKKDINAIKIDNYNHWSETRKLRKESDQIQPYKTMTDDHEARITTVENKLVTYQS